MSFGKRQQRVSQRQLCRAEALRQIAERGYATTADIAKAIECTRGAATHALLYDARFERRMDYARMSGAKQFVYVRRSAQS